jgi:hypothetical protein
MGSCTWFITAVAISSSAWGSVVYVQNGQSLWSTYNPVFGPPPPPRDINADGVLDLGFAHPSWSFNGSHGYWFEDYSVGGSGFSTAPVSVGSVVGRSSSFNSGMQLGEFDLQFDGDSHFTRHASLSIPEGDSYRGLSFVGPGGVLSYGWVHLLGHMELSGTLDGFVSVNILEYAYESQPDVPIIVPAPAGVAAVGALGI